MFAMLHGAWPRMTSDGIDLAVLEADVAAGRADASALERATDQLVAEVLAVQAEAGMDLLTDGQVRSASLTEATRLSLFEGRFATGRPLLAAWQAATAAAPEGTSVAQAIPGPYTLGRRAIEDALAKTRDAGEEPPSAPDVTAARVDVTLSIAHSLADEIEALAGAGCKVIVVEEPDAVTIGTSASERSLLTNASKVLLERSNGIHAMLAITGGSAHEVGGAAIFEAPWQSLLVDLIAGPDNWVLVRQAPGDRGIICAALTIPEDGPEVDQAPELVWASQYAASSNGRGIARVGLANATRLADRTPEAARRAVSLLAKAAKFAGMPVAEAVEAGLDARTIRDARPVPATNNRASRRRQARDAKRDAG